MSQHIANNYFSYAVNNRVQTLGSSNESQTSRIRRAIVPRNISIDKEALYEQLIKEKKLTNQLRLENQTLNFKLAQLNKEDNNMDSNNNKKAFQSIKVIIQKKDSELQQLKESISYKGMQELRNLNDKLNKEIQQLKQYYKFDGDKTLIIEDNVNLLNLLESQKKYIHDLEKIRTEYIQIKAKHTSQQQLLIIKEQQLQKFRDRDPLSEINLIKQHSKNEVILLDELVIRKDEIDHLQTKLNQCQIIIQEKEKSLQDLNFDSQQRIQHLETENKNLSDKLNKIQNENNNLKEKQQQIEIYLQKFQKAKLSTQTLIYNDEQPLAVTTQFFMSPLNSPNNHDNMVKQVKKQQIEKFVTELKLSLIKKRISLQDAELILFQNDQISIDEIEKLLKEDPFNLKNSILLARYLIEDYSDKDFVYNQELTATNAQVKSVFRNLFQNYKLNFDTEIIDYVQKKYKESIIEFCSKKGLQTITIDEINQCMNNQQDNQWTQKHSDYLRQSYYNKYNKYQQFELKKLIDLFEEQQTLQSI